MLLRERRQELIGDGSISLEEFDVALTTERETRAALDAAKSRLDELVEGTRTEELARQRAVVAELTAAVERAAVDVEDTTLRAPFDGTIVRRDLHEGAVVDAGTPLLHVLERAPLEVRVGIPVDQARLLELDTVVRLEVRGEPVAGRVAALVPDVDPRTRTVDVVVTLEEQQATAARRTPHVPGEIARLALDEPIEDSGFWMPTAALVQGSSGLWSAYAIGDEVENDVQPGRLARVERRELEVLATTGDRSLVRGTLSAGDEIVVDGVHRIVPGQIVRTDTTR